MCERERQSRQAGTPVEKDTIQNPKETLIIMLCVVSDDDACTAASAFGWYPTEVHRGEER